MMNGTRCEDFKNGQISSARQQKARKLALTSAALTPSGLTLSALGDRVVVYIGLETSRQHKRDCMFPHGSDSSIC